MPCPGASVGARFVQFTEDLTVGEHAVVVAQVIRGHAFGLRDHPMMRVVKEQNVIVVRAMFADATDEFVRVPFVDDDEVSALECVLEIECRERVLRGTQLRIGGMEAANWFLAVFRAQALQAPRILRLINVNAVAARHQLRGDAAEEMRVAVIPVRQERVIKHYDAHAFSMYPGCSISPE